MLVLASAYLFSGLMALLHLLTFPGAVTPDAQILGFPQTVAWLYVFWGLGFIALLFIAVVLNALRPDHLLAMEVAQRALLMGVLGVFAVVALLLVFATLGLDWLPPPMSGDRFAHVNVALNMSRSLLAVAALAILWTVSRRRASILILWLSVTLVAAAAGPILTDLGARRYTFGWYAGRVSFAFASAVLLFVLLAEFARLQRALAGTVESLQAQTRLLEAEIARRELAERKLIQGQKMEAVGRLAGGVAHDFNNVLAAVIANLELILRTVKEEPLRQLAEKAKEIALRGAHLTRSLVAFAGRQPLRVQLIETDELLDRFGFLMQKAVGAAVKVTIVSDPHVWPICADPDQLEVALLNLAFNAREAMPGGGVMRLESCNVGGGNGHGLPPDADLEPGEYVAISVSDSGVGIPPEHTGKIFEPFFTTKEFGKGSGLGLSQVQGFVRQSGGDVVIDSRARTGTHVALYFPRAKA